MSSQQRLHALDAVRAFALLAGIVLHATMSFFLPIPAKDVSQSSTLATVFSLIHPWRMTTFFVIAGLLARLVIEKRGTRGFAADRAKRRFVYSSTNPAPTMQAQANRTMARPGSTEPAATRPSPTTTPAAKNRL